MILLSLACATCERAYHLDEDGDGFGAIEPVYSCREPANAVDNALDCDDGDPSRIPDQVHEGDIQLFEMDAPPDLLGECIGVIAGDVWIANTSMATVDAFASVQQIQGSLTVSGSSGLFAVDGLSRLERVDGDLALSGGVLESMEGLSGLREVGGSLRLGGLPATLSTAPLAEVTVGGLVLGRELPDLQGLPAFDELGELGLQYVDQPDLVVLSELDRVTGGVHILSGPDDIALPVTWVGGDVHIDGRPDLTVLGAVEEIGGSLSISSHRGTDLAGMEQLQRIGGDLIVDGNDELTSLEGLERLEQVGGDFRVEWNPSLVRPGALPALSQVQGDVSFANDRVLTDLVGLELLADAGSIHIGDGLAMTRVEGLEGLERVGRFRADNDLLVGLGDHDALVEVDELLLGGSSLLDVGSFIGVRSAELVSVSGAVQTLDGLVQLEEVGTLSLSGLEEPHLAGLDGLALAEVLSLMWIDASGLPELPALTDVGLLKVQECDGPEDLAGLESVRRVEELVLQDNDRLVDLSALHGLESVGRVEIVWNESLAAAEIEAFLAAVEVTGEVVVENNLD